MVGLHLVLFNNMQSGCLILGKHYVASLALKGYQGCWVKASRSVQASMHNLNMRLPHSA